jgi:hypothetical protein
MHWIAPSEHDAQTGSPEMRLWDSAHHFRTHSLRRTRDLLLPRLLSGQVEVGKLEGVIL